MNKVAEFLAKLLSGGLLEGTTNLLDEIITNKEERQILLNELKKAEYQHIGSLEYIRAKLLEAELNAEVELRKQAVKLATESQSWLGKNIAPILGLISTATAIVVYILVLTHQLKATEPTVLLVVSNITNIVLVVFGFYFGSSVGSRLKDK